MSAESDHMGRVSELPCVACDACAPSIVHHIRKYERIKNAFITIPLCYECHVGDFSIHTTPKQFTEVYGSQMGMLAKTIGMLSKNRGV